MASGNTYLDGSLILTDIIEILHLYLFGWGAEEGDKLLGRQAKLGLEGITIHIVEHAAQEGATLGILAGFVEVAHDDEQASVAHLAFEDETELHTFTSPARTRR